MAKTAVHFGAGDIGRGFVAQLLHESGYDVTFADVNDELVGALQSQPNYTVTSIGEGGTTVTVDSYRAINSRTHEQELIAAVQVADIVTTSVGIRVLRFVAPIIAAGLELRTKRAQLIVIACESGLNGTDALAAEVRRHVNGDNVIFANCSIDRLVPQQGGGLDVAIEKFYEWIIDRTPFDGETPQIAGVTWVDNLTPHAERKFYTVNTASAAAAYYGADGSWVNVRDALAVPELQAKVRAVLAETKTLLVAKHGFRPADQQAYIEATMLRISNPQLADTCERVGRNPLRKINGNERLIGPAAQLAERGLNAWNLLAVVAAALRFDYLLDGESVELQELLRSGATADAIAATLTGLGNEHPLFANVVEVVQLRLLHLAAL